MRLVLRQYNKDKDVNKNVNWWIKKDGWGYISIYQKLSEGFIEKHQDKVSWTWIFSHQKLSEKFIDKHHNEIWWHHIFKYQKLSPEFREKWKHKCV